MGDSPVFPPRDTLSPVKEPEMRKPQSPSHARGETDRWETGLYAFGFNPSADNNLTIRVEMEDEDSAFNEQQTIDLTPWLRGFDGDELSLELDLHIGKELTIDDPVIIPEWEDTPETDLSNL